jgi:hypothetical protein
MEKQSTVRIELTKEQRDKIKETSGKDIAELEFTLQELEQRIAPTSLNFTHIEY